jgi:demethylmenaquinone methyltransferase/2-methoxy-6-polyprenyl-1,4-benzoquinol methylase
VTAHADTELTAYYAARAKEYERIYIKPERQADLARLRKMIPQYLADRDVLEVACGTGYWTQFIAPLAHSVTATDINPETLEIARTKAYPPGRVTIEQADVYRLPPSEQRFTGAFAGFWWSHLEHRERRGFVNVLHRALASGAVVVALDNLYVTGSSTPVHHVDAAGNAFQERRLDDGSLHLVLKNFPTKDELLADIEGLGTAAEYTALDYYWLLKYEVR